MMPAKIVGKAPKPILIPYTVPMFILMLATLDSTIFRATRKDKYTISLVEIFFIKISLLPFLMAVCYSATPTEKGFVPLMWQRTR